MTAMLIAEEEQAQQKAPHKVYILGSDLLLVYQVLQWVDIVTRLRWL